MPGLRGARRDYLGAPADVPDVRLRGVLRFEPAPTCRRTFSRDRPPRHALRRAGGELAVVLYRHPTGLTFWQAGRAMSETTEDATGPEPVAPDPSVASSAPTG